MASPDDVITYDELWNYECSSGLVLPFINEYTWGTGVRAVLYLVGLLYCFLGVALIADRFMCAIEEITSKTRKIYVAKANDSEPEVIEVRIWNDTVANLTLMALGSSAPEILLSCIEIVGKGFKAGEMGPGTIVGSAAFNLMVISAVCIVGIPEGETRQIKAVKVFMVTAIFSIFAYLWLLIILIGNTPNVVDLWEAIVTFLAFPLLVLLAFMADKGHWRFNWQTKDKQIELGGFQPGESQNSEKVLRDQYYFKDGKLDKESLVEFVRELKKRPGLSDEDAAVLAATKLAESQHHSRLWYRIGAVRDISGSKKTRPQLSMKLKEVYDVMNEHPDAPTLGPLKELQETRNAIIEFHAATCAVMEDVGKVSVLVTRHGKVDIEASVRVETIDGSAVSEEDYIPVNQVLTFAPGETEKEVEVQIVNDDQWEPDEEFFLKLSTLADSDDAVELGRISIQEITILNDDNPGTIVFKKRGILVQENIGTVLVPVMRKNGADGQITVKWRTIDDTAVEGKDYVGGQGELTFRHAETELEIPIQIINDFEAEKSEHFEVELYEPAGGAKVGPISRCVITITNDDEFNSIMNRITVMTSTNMDKFRVNTDTWGEQFKHAMSVNGGDLEVEPAASDYVMHVLTFFWKLLFAFVPPPRMMGGWLAFFVALAFIAVLTAVIGDLASIFGCLIGLEDSVTAITLVALGTSLPDTFASKQAATAEKYADNAIGNITGSNSVNVFLGLGLPWLIAAIYHAAVEEVPFEVKAGKLGFSVTLFTACALVTLFIFFLRRKLNLFGKAELGGPVGPKYASALLMVALWFVYIIVASLQVYGHIPGF